MNQSQALAALTCTGYLSYTSVDVLFRTLSNSNAQVEQQILGGDFVFFHYASCNWLSHVELYSQGALSNDQLTAVSLTLWRLFSVRHHQIPERFDALSSSKFKAFQSDPSLHFLLGETSRLLEKAQMGLVDQDGEPLAVRKKKLG